MERFIQETYEWGGERAWKLVCPVCGDEHIHLTALTCVRDTDRTNISKEGIFTSQTKNKMSGVTISLQYTCENYHVGTVTLQFHEGCTYATLEASPDEKSEAYQSMDIWRD